MPDKVPEKDKKFWLRMQWPFKKFLFLLHFLYAIVVIGCLGIWIELIRFINADSPSLDGIQIALATFFPAFIGVSGAHSILVAFDNRDKALNYFSSIVPTIALIIAALIGIFYKTYPSISLCISIFFTLFAVLFWVYLNWSDPVYDVNVDTAVGGDTDRQLKGNMQEFKK